MLWYFWRIVMQLNDIALYRRGVLAYPHWYKWDGHNNRNTLACIMRRIMDLLNIITLIKVWFIAVISNETAFYLEYKLAIKCRQQYFMIIRKQAADSWWIIFGCSSDILQGSLLNVNTSEHLSQWEGLVYVWAWGERECDEAAACCRIQTHLPDPYLPLK